MSGYEEMRKLLKTKGVRAGIKDILGNIADRLDVDQYSELAQIAEGKGLDLNELLENSGSITNVRQKMKDILDEAIRGAPAAAPKPKMKVTDMPDAEVLHAVPLPKPAAPKRKAEAAAAAAAPKRKAEAAAAAAAPKRKAEAAAAPAPPMRQQRITDSKASFNPYGKTMTMEQAQAQMDTAARRMGLPEAASAAPSASTFFNPSGKPPTALWEDDEEEKTGKGYKLRKAPKKSAYWVTDVEGKKYSKEPLPKERARQQQKALYAARSRKLKGSALMITQAGGGKGKFVILDPNTGRTITVRGADGHNYSTFSTKEEAERALRHVTELSILEPGYAKGIADDAQTPVGRPSITTNVPEARMRLAARQLMLEALPKALAGDTDPRGVELLPKTEKRKMMKGSGLTEGDIDLAMKTEEEIAEDGSGGWNSRMINLVENMMNKLSPAQAKRVGGETIQRIVTLLDRIEKEADVSRPADVKLAEALNEALVDVYNAVFKGSPRKAVKKTFGQMKGSGLEKLPNETEEVYQKRLLLQKQQTERLARQGITPEKYTEGMTAKARAAQLEKAKKALASQSTAAAYERDPSVVQKRAEIAKKAETAATFEPILKGLVGVAKMATNAPFLPGPVKQIGSMTTDYLGSTMDATDAARQARAEAEAEKAASLGEYTSDLDRQRAEALKQLGVSDVSQIDWTDINRQIEEQNRIASSALGQRPRFGAARYF